MMVTVCVLHALVLVLVLLENASLTTGDATTSSDSDPCPPGFQVHSPGYWCAAISEAPCRTVIVPRDGGELGTACI